MSTTMRRISVLLIALVVCVGMLGIGATDSYAASKPAKVSVTSVKAASYNSIKVTWKSAKNAKKYEIYRATSKNGTYKKIKTTTSKSYTNTKLTFNKTYYYKVRGVNGTKKGSFSSVKSAKTALVMPKIYAWGTSASTVGWSLDSEIKGASKIEVYLAEDKAGPFEKVDVVPGDYWGGMIGELTEGKEYFVKIRGYRTSNGKTVYSSYSAVKSCIPEIPCPEETANLEYEITPLEYNGEPSGVLLKVENKNDKDVYINGFPIYKDAEGHNLAIGECYGYAPAHSVIYLRDWTSVNYTSIEPEVVVSWFVEEGDGINIDNSKIEQVGNLIVTKYEYEDLADVAVKLKNTATKEYSVGICMIARDKDGNIIDGTEAYVEIGAGKTKTETVYGMKTGEGVTYEVIVNWAGTGL